MSEDGDLGAAVEVDVERDGDEAVVRVRGEIDLSSAAVLEAAVAPLLGAGGPERIVFDLEQLRFMDSSALAVLVVVARSGKAVRLREPSAVIREVVAATGLGDVLPVEP